MKEQISNYSEPKEKVTSQPYVVSGDIPILLEEWSMRNDFALPSQRFFNQLRGEFNNEFQQMFPNYEFVDEVELSKELKDMVDKTDLFPISLDRVYYPTSPEISISRITDPQDIKIGLGRRRDSGSLFSQFRELKKMGIKKAVIVDDVVFGGNVLKRVIETCQGIGIDIPVVCTAIAIGNGVDVLKSRGIEVKSVKTYPEVIDEICERDFYPGVPLCGRTIDSIENVGAPYLLPFGNPQKWASIPKAFGRDFSLFCLRQSIELFGEIERVSGKPVTCFDVERKVIGMPNDSTRFIDFLFDAYKQVLSVVL